MRTLRLTLEFDDKTYGILYDDVDAINPVSIGKVVEVTVIKHLGTGFLESMLPVEIEET